MYNMYMMYMDKKSLETRPAMPRLLIEFLICMVLLCATAAQGGEIMSFRIESPDFKEGESIPQRFGCDGQDISPGLVWADPPEGTRSFVLTVEDPDAPMGVFVHWVIYDLPSSARGLEQGIKGSDARLKGAKQGKTSFGQSHYGGPCPPRGHGTHRYIFTLRALDIPALDVAPGSKKGIVEKAMKGHVLAEARTTGTYQR